MRDDRRTMTEDARTEEYPEGRIDGVPARHGDQGGGWRAPMSADGAADASAEDAAAREDPAGREAGEGYAHDTYASSGSLPDGYAGDRDAAGVRPVADDRRYDDAEDMDRASSESVAADRGTMPEATATGTQTGATGVVADDENVALFDPAQAGELHEQWNAIQAGFIDDPHDAVVAADSLLGGAVSTLTQRLSERTRDLHSRWDGSEARTEEMRLALRDYRSLLNRLLAV